MSGAYASEEILILLLARRFVFCKYFAARQGADREVYHEGLEARVSDRPKRQSIDAKDVDKIV